MARRIETGSIDIDAIKDQFPLADEVRRHLPLKRRGATLVGLCPFHMERTPSFAVYPDEERFHCFGCGAHGDIFDFLEAQEGLDIRAAAERLTGGNFPVMSEARVAELRARQARFEAEQAERRGIDHVLGIVEHHHRKAPPRARLVGDQRGVEAVEAIGLGGRPVAVMQDDAQPRITSSI